MTTRDSNSRNSIRAKSRRAKWTAVTVAITGAVAVGSGIHTSFNPAYNCGTVSSGALVEQLPTGSVYVSPERPATLAFDGVRLDIPAHALSRNTPITVQPLSPDELPELDLGMHNVTGRHGGFRMGPHGLKFDKPIRVEIPFDTLMLPVGTTVEDIRTFYFDEEAERWFALERIAVDHEAGALVSATDHFTDFINATLTVPDHPTVADFAPNSLKELAFAEPGARITLIDPPAAQPDGDAELSFPLSLPPGRRGLQPDLTVTYSSSGGNGWMGVGWDVQAPAIQVDTAFGVPRYSRVKETETYLLNGRYLHPTADLASPAPRSSAAKTFYRRIEGSFGRIVRHGTAPDSYWWEVTDKQGTRYIYGQTSQARLQGVGLTPGAFDVFRWNLERIEDVHGNTIEYAYFTDSGVPQPAGEPWTQTYIRQIDYTGGGASGAYYRVVFHLDSGGRVDKRSTGLPGFKVVTRHLLQSVDVLANAELVRKYEFAYVTGDFNKTLLKEIKVLGEDGTEFHKHVFEYTALGDDFDGSGGPFTPCPDVNGDGLPDPCLGSEETWTGMVSDDDHTYTSSFGGGGDAFVGGGTPYCIVHGGGGGGGGGGGSDTELSFVDVNGDGLPDRLKQGGRLERNAFNVNDADNDGVPDRCTTPTCGWTGSFDQTGNLTGAPEPLGSGSDWNAHANVGAHLINDLIVYGHSWVWSHSYDDRLIADANGDGFPDVVDVDSGGFEVRQSAVLADGTQVLGPWESWGGYTLDGIDLDEPGRDQEVLDAFNLSNPIRQLIAPYTGQVRITGGVQKVRPGGDGVEVSIYHNGSLIWERTIDADDTGACIPGPSNSCDTGMTLTVLEGDRLYFMASSVAETSDDDLVWAPKVTYTSGDASHLEPYGAKVYEFDAQADFRLAGPPDARWVPTANGTVRVHGPLVKETTSDDVVVRITKCFDTYPVQTDPDSSTDRGDGKCDEHDDPPIEEVYTRYFSGSEESTVDVDEMIDVSALEVAPGEFVSPTLSFTVSSDTQIDPNRVRWEPTITYEGGTYCRQKGAEPEVCSTVSCAPDPSGEIVCTMPNDPAPEVPILPETVTQPAQVYVDVHRPRSSVAPTRSWEVPEDGAFRISVRWMDLFGPTFRTGPVILYVQRLNGLIEKRVVPPGQPSAEFCTDALLTQGDRLYFTALWDNEDDYCPDCAPLPCPCPSGMLQVQIMKAPPPTTGSGGTAQGACCVPNANCEFDCTPLTEADCAAAQGVYQGDGSTCGSPFFACAPIHYPDPPVNLQYREAPPPRLAGGYHGWSYGEWNGNEAFDDNELANPDKDPSGEKYVTAVPRRQGADDAPPGPAWTAAGFDLYIVAEGVKPSRVGMNAVAELDRVSGRGSGPGTLRHSLSRTQEDRINAVLYGLSTATGYTDGKIDYLDMNADQYPDQVSEGQVRFANPHVKAFGPLEAIPGLSGKPRRMEDANVSQSIGMGANYTKKDGKGKAKWNVSTMPSIGSVTAVSQVRSDLVDVNGDGLPDRVAMVPDTQTVAVQLNLGYRFGLLELWTMPQWTTSDRCRETLDLLDNFPTVGDVDSVHALGLTSSASGSVGVGLGGGGDVSASSDVSFGVGGGVGTTLGRDVVELTDVNGDGLADHVFKDDGENFFRVKLNRGDGWEAETRWYVPGWNASLGDGYQPGDFFQCLDAVSLAGHFNWDASANFGVCFTIYCAFVPCFGIQIEIAGSVAGGHGGLQVFFWDIDGDGLPDHVLKKDDDPYVYVKRNKAGKVNLLKKVVRPLGGSITLDYRRQGNRVDYSDPEHKIDMPSSQWELASTIVDDGRGNTIKSEFEYFNDGYFDRAERQAYGYARVRERVLNRDGTDALTVTDRYYYNQDFYRRNLPKKVVTTDGTGNLFLIETSTYELRTVAGPCTPDDLYPGACSVFPALIRTTKFVYDGTTTDENTSQRSDQVVEYEYDAYGNVTAFRDFVDVGPEDDQYVTIGYHHDPSTWIFKPDLMEVRDHTGRLMRGRSSIYDNRGNLLSLEETLVGGRHPETGTPYDGTANPTWTFTYRPDGNIRTVVDPKGYTLEFSYDLPTQTHVTQVTDSFGLTTLWTHDLRFGLPTEITDQNGNTTVRQYDGFGRLINLYGPYDGIAGPAIWVDYAHHASPPYAVTHHKDITRRDPIETVVFVDGLQRMIQTKRDHELDLGDATTVGMQVSGKLEFDGKGRVVSEGQPVFDSGPATDFVDLALLNPKHSAYDALDRVRQVTFPDGAVTRVDYGFGELDGVLREKRTRTDAEGRQTHTYLDVTDIIVGVEQFNTIAGQQLSLVTRHGYNAMVELTSVTDAAGNVTRIEYDTLGRRTAIDSPDAGVTEFRYDLAGNLGEKITANLAALGQAIRYDYSYNRLERIDYPEMQDVTFRYGDPGAAYNRAGRIVAVTDATGVETRSYGKLGELVRTVKISNTLGGYSPQGPYVTDFEYDSFNRLLAVIYPDGERLEYGYDAGGSVQSAVGTHRGVRYEYITHVGYDEFGARSRILYGNGVQTRLHYETRTRRLVQMESVLASGEPMQNLLLDYDNVGTIVSLENDVPPPRPNTLGGLSRQQFQYDDLYQLTHSEGTYRGGRNRRSRYTLDVQYDGIGNIARMQQLHERLQANGGAHTRKRTSYDRSYVYDGQKPHAPTSVGDWSYIYDPNGNQAGWEHDASGKRRNITWDEENRIHTIADNGRTTRFLYDVEGRRTNKRGPHGETVYVSPLFSVRNGAIASKHIFVDRLRVATKLTQPAIRAAGALRGIGEEKPAPAGGRAPDASRPGRPVERKLYFYHGNQLSSSHFVTDNDGEIYQHLEYFPFGGLWVDDRSESQRTPYLFNGKELDEETGLYYFQARYYDPGQGQWLSADPVLDGMLAADVLELPDLSVRPFRLPGQLYAFVSNSPIERVDPTGLRDSDAVVPPARQRAQSVPQPRQRRRAIVLGRAEARQMRKDVWRRLSKQQKAEWLKQMKPAAREKWERKPIIRHMLRLKRFLTLEKDSERWKLEVGPEQPRNVVDGVVDYVSVISGTEPDEPVVGGFGPHDAELIEVGFLGRAGFALQLGGVRPMEGRPPSVGPRQRSPAEAFAP